MDFVIKSVFVNGDSNLRGADYIVRKTFAEQITKEELHRLYWEEGKTTEEIGRLYNVGQTPVLALMRELGITRRQGGKEKIPEFLTAEELSRLYIDEGKSIGEIARLYRRNGKHVRILMKRYGIQLRPAGKQQLEDKISVEEISHLYWKEEKTLKELALHLKVGTNAVLNFMERNNIPRRTKREKFETLITKEELQRLYYDEKKTITEIGMVYNVSTNAVSKLMEKWGVEKRELTSVDRLRNIYKDSPIVMLEERVTKEELHNLYWKEGKNLEEIGGIYGVHQQTVSKLMDRWGIPKRKTSESHAPLRKKVSKEILEDLYVKQRKSANEISKIVGASNRGIDCLLDYYGIPKRSHQESCQIFYSENTNFNVDFFKRKSREFFYILGLLLTDGAIQENDRVSIGLTDLDVIEWIARTIELKTVIHKSVRKSNIVAGRELKKPSKPVYRIAFLNKEVAQILRGYGLEPNKTHTLKFPIIPDEFMPDFLRGVLDGDGTISVYEYKNKNSYGYKYAISYASASFDFIKAVKESIENLIGGERKIIQMANGVYVYSVSAQWDVYQFATLLYENEAFGMSRKKEKVLSLLETPPQKAVRFVIPKEEFKNLYIIQEKSIDEIASIYGLNRKSVYQLLYTYGYKKR
ncbi:hypothetical protein ACS2JV_26575 [Bacillus cereus group sp. BceL102]|uniref:hypothetical protein n=1 Tax=Bacillus TaxID=1386 RepID=UPI0015872624|nr:hypothetical protein [Bacillus sp. P14-1]